MSKDFNSSNLGLISCLSVASSCNERIVEYDNKEV